MEGWRSKMLQIPCNMKGYIFHILQMPCKMRGSISTMQVDVAECWTYWKYQANVGCLSLCFFGLYGFACFLSSWFYKALRVSWLHGFVCVHLTATTATRVRKSQTQPTPKRRPQHQQLWACSSSYTNNHHNSNSNNNSNNNKKLLLQL